MLLSVTVHCIIQSSWSNCTVQLQQKVLSTGEIQSVRDIYRYPAPPLVKALVTVILLISCQGKTVCFGITWSTDKVALYYIHSEVRSEFSLVKSDSANTGCWSQSVLNGQSSPNWCLLCVKRTQLMPPVQIFSKSISRLAVLTDAFSPNIPTVENQWELQYCLLSRSTCCPLKKILSSWMDNTHHSTELQCSCYTLEVTDPHLSHTTGHTSATLESH